MGADADEKRIEYLENALHKLRDDIDRAIDGDASDESNDELVARLMKEAEE